MSYEKSVADKFRLVTTIRHKDNIVIANVTVGDRPGGGKMLSFQLQKEYVDGEDTKHTAWFGRRHIPAIREILNQLEEQLLLEEEKARKVG